MEDERGLWFLRPVMQWEDEERASWGLAEMRTEFRKRLYKEQLMEPQEIISGLKEAYRSGCPYLVIYSRRQDIGIQKCEYGVQAGYLRFEEVPIDSQETHWRYHWTDKAREEWA